MMAGMKTVRVALVAGIGVLIAAAPAGAATPMLASQKYQWYYWTAPILALSGVGMIFFLSGGYIMKVLFPKYRGRKVKE
jgi:hypothetical protein